MAGFGADRSDQVTESAHHFCHYLNYRLLFLRGTGSMNQQLVEDGVKRMNHALGVGRFPN